MAKLRSGLPWWAVLLLVLAILAVLGMVIYFIWKFILFLAVCVLLCIGMWAWVKHKTSPGTVHDDGSGHYSDDDIDYQNMDTTGGQKPSRRKGSDMGQSVTCPQCNGTGNMGNAFYPKTCDVCSGTGRLDVSNTAVQCPNCRGEGKNFSPSKGQMEKCTICHGTGRVKPTRR